MQKDKSQFANFRPSIRMVSLYFIFYDESPVLQNRRFDQVFEQYADSIVYSFAQGDLCFDKRNPGNSIGYSGGRHLRCRAHDSGVLDSIQKTARLPVGE